MQNPEDPNSEVLGFKIHTLSGFWTLKPYYLGSWTLRESAYYVSTHFRPMRIRSRHRRKDLKEYIGLRSILLRRLCELLQFKTAGL